MAEILHIACNYLPWGLPTLKHCADEFKDLVLIYSDNDKEFSCPTFISRLKTANMFNKDIFYAQAGNGLMMQTLNLITFRLGRKSFEQCF